MGTTDDARLVMLHEVGCNLFQNICCMHFSCCLSIGWNPDLGRISRLTPTHCALDMRTLLSTGDLAATPEIHATKLMTSVGLSSIFKCRAAGISA